MRFLLTLVLAITTGVMAQANQFVYEFVVDGISYRVLSSSHKTVEVKSNYEAKYAGDMVIPAKVNYNGVDYKVVAIGGAAFFYCSKLTSIKLGSNIQKIGRKAFKECTSLKDISLDGNIRIIETEAFNGCGNLRKLVIPSNVQEVGDRAFNRCHGVSQLVICDGVKKLGYESFGVGDSVTDISIPVSVDRIGYSCFSSCSNIKNFRVEDGENPIDLGNYPWGQSTIDNFYLGRNVTGLWDVSFMYAREITIGRNVNKLMWYKYIDLETLNLHCTTPPTSTAFTEAQYATVKINVPAGCLEAYQKAEPWCHFKSIQDTLPAAIDEVEADKDEVVAVYAIDGTPCTMNDKGVKVVKMKSGKTMKVVK